MATRPDGCTAGADDPPCLELAQAARLVDGSLDRATAARIERQLAACARCRERVARIAREPRASAADTERDASGTLGLGAASGATLPGGPRAQAAARAAELADTFAPAAADLAAPTSSLSFDERYHEEGALGRGGMGIVQLCRDTAIGRTVALKLLRDTVDSPMARARFAWEARVQGQLEHPSVVPVYDLGITPDGRPYFTMKRVRGVTLSEILRDRDDERFGRRRLLAALAQVCLAIDFAHQHQIVHRDLKPANLMLGDFGEVYVLDWGLAKADDTLVGEAAAELPSGETPETLAGSLVGTPGYMAPEQMAGEALGPRTDVYALGAILFEILAGERLQPRRSFDDLRAAVSAPVDARPSQRAPERDLPPELDELCVRATASDPAARIASARELHDRLQAYLDGDRDQLLRRDLARQHAAAARTAAAGAHGGGPVALAERRTALRELGRALALDPANAEALDGFLALVAAPPTELPPEVAAELARADAERMQRSARAAAIAYASSILYLPLYLVCGIRQPLPVVAFFALVLVAAGLSLRQSLRSPSSAAVLFGLVITTIALALTASFYGALILTPMAIAVNAIGYAVAVGRRYRTAVIVTAGLGIAVPIVLELLGWGGHSYEFSARGMLVVPRALGITPTTAVLLLSLGSVALVASATIAVCQVRDALGDAERSLVMHSWHLRQFLPELGRGR